MTTIQKIFTICIIFATIVLLFFIYEQEILPDLKAVTATPPIEKMTLTVYVQNKKIAEMTDCEATQKITYEIPRTTQVADASLKILFENELAEFGEYDSVTVVNNVARVKIKNEIQSLSSCEAGHLTSVLTDTLTQYPTITSVELYSPKTKIEF